MQSLHTYQAGQSGIVLTVDDNELTAKLVEMGIYEGQQITVLYKAPLGDPIAVKVSGYVLSLRLDEAALIQMKPAST